MNGIIALLVGVLSGTGIYLLFFKDYFERVLGLSLLSYAVNLFIFSMGRLQSNAVPIVKDGVQRYADPLPPALVLTAIVIGFAMTALVLVLAIKRNQKIMSPPQTEEKHD